MTSETEPSDRLQQGPSWRSARRVSWVSMEKPRDSGFQTEPLGCLAASSYLQEMLTLGTLEVPYPSSARTGRTIAVSSCDLRGAESSSVILISL